jgi:hypothetical protein
VEFCTDSMGLKASQSVIVRRALAYYWAGVKQKLNKAKKAVDPQAATRKLLRAERESIKWAAGRPDFKEPTDEDIETWLKENNIV